MKEINIWKGLAVIFIFFSILLFLFNLMGISATGFAVTQNNVIDRVIDYIDKNMISGVKLVEVFEESGLYKIIFDDNGKLKMAYATKDGRIMFTNFIELSDVLDEKDGTFYVKNGLICEENEKPIIRLFSTNTCGHCEWVKNAYDEVIEEYKDKVVAYHWEKDMQTGEWKDLINGAEWKDDEETLFESFTERIGVTGYVPAFIFGCKYYRVGNGFEEENNLEKEKQEFRRIIDLLEQ